MFPLILARFRENHSFWFLHLLTKNGSQYRFPLQFGQSRLPRENQVQVAKFVPQVMAPDGFGIRDLNMVNACQCS